MKKINQIYLLIFLHCFSFTKIDCQLYFSKIVNPDFSTSSLVSDTKVSNDTIMIFTDHFCDTDSALCSSVRYMNDSGNLFEEILIDSFNMGNREVAHVNSNNIILSGHELFWPGDKLSFLIISKTLQDVQRKSFTPFPYHILVNKGLLFWKNNYYAYGDMQINSQSPVKGFIIKLDKNLEKIIDSFIYELDDAESRVDDLQITPDNNLSFISKGRRIGGTKSYYRIYKIDSLGTILNTFVHESGVNIDIDGILQITANNEHIYLSKSEDYSFATDINSINGEDYSHNWSVNLPFNFYSPLRTYEINDLALTKDDRIIGCGIVEQEDEEGIFYSTGLIFKISKEGIVEWQRNINLLNPFYTMGNNDKYRTSSLLTIRELDNGDILSIGYVIERDSFGLNQGFDLWIVKTDSEGCIDAENCSEFILSEEKVTSKKIKVFPNPANDYFNIHSEKSFAKLLIYNSYGQIVYSKNTELNRKNIRVDISNLNDGFYILALIDSENKMSIKKFSKF